MTSLSFPLCDKYESYSSGLHMSAPSACYCYCQRWIYNISPGASAFSINFLPTMLKDPPLLTYLSSDEAIQAFASDLPWHRWQIHGLSPARLCTSYALTFLLAALLTSAHELHPRVRVRSVYSTRVDESNSTILEQPRTPKTVLHTHSIHVGPHACVRKPPTQLRTKTSKEPRDKDALLANPARYHATLAPFLPHPRRPSLLHRHRRRRAESLVSPGVGERNGRSGPQPPVRQLGRLGHDHFPRV